MADQLNRQATPAQLQCTSPLVEREDGIWYCPTCGWEVPALNNATKAQRLDRKIKALEKELAALKAKRAKMEQPNV
jgi:uncharacterized Zn finger protein (UPF0148 family)